MVVCRSSGETDDHSKLYIRNMGIMVVVDYTLENTPSDSQPSRPPSNESNTIEFFSYFF